MKNIFLLGCSLGLLVTAAGQQPVTHSFSNLPVSISQTDSNEHTLLFEITGNGLTKPSYLFGTMHLMCASDTKLSDNLKSIIRETDLIYFEIDMDNFMEMLGAVKYLKMKDNKKLSDLLTPDEYKRVKAYFNNMQMPMPFSLMESFKPFFLSSMISEQKMDCPEKEGMEQAIIAESRQYRKEIKGLESIAFQASVFDSIPYNEQAKELVKSIDSVDKNSESTEELVSVYKQQDLQKIGELTQKEEGGLGGYMDLLLYNRNADWARKMNVIMKKNGALFAVGAAHLPGEKGVISLLRRNGYTVKPVSNNNSKLL